MVISFRLSVFRDLKGLVLSTEYDHWMGMSQRVEPTHLRCVKRTAPLRISTIWSSLLSCVGLFELFFFSMGQSHIRLPHLLVRPLALVSS